MCLPLLATGEWGVLCVEGVECHQYGQTIMVRRNTTIIITQQIILTYSFSPLPSRDWWCCWYSPLSHLSSGGSQVQGWPPAQSGKSPAGSSTWARLWWGWWGRCQETIHLPTTSIINITTTITWVKLSSLEHRLRENIFVDNQLGYPAYQDYQEVSEHYYQDTADLAQVSPFYQECTFFIILTLVTSFSDF